MGKTDLPIALDLDGLKVYLTKRGVVFAYLFGSLAKGSEGSLSDVDMALYFTPHLSKSERFDLRLRIIGETSPFFKGRTTDVVILNDAPIGLAYEVIKEGVLLYCLDEASRVEVETRILSKYLDRRYYDKRHAETVLRQIAHEGLIS